MQAISNLTNQNIENKFCENCECVTQHYKNEHEILNLGTVKASISKNFSIGKAHQKYGEEFITTHGAENKEEAIKYLTLVTCVQCENFILKYNDKVIYPLNNSSIPKPNQNLDDDLKEIYEEARAVYGLSVRSSGALLRLLLQIFVNRYLGKPETGNLSKGIESLIEQEGIPDQIIQIMTIIRVKGNDCAHPSELDSLDTTEEIRILFELINLLVEILIERPKQIQKLYNSIPDEKKPKEFRK